MKFICQVCGYVYDEDTEKTPFDQLENTWQCPWCKAPKQEFRPEKEEPRETVGEAAPEAVPEDSDLKKLNAGQLAALCTSLSRGCEKMYREEESELFAQLADYFTSRVQPVRDDTVSALSALLQEDIASCPDVRAVADRHGDRGAARALVWGEKVTRMLSSLVNRYQKEGEEMLAGTEIWICTACGFVYIGDTPPELCPVCKVPSWKFEKVEGR